ncbi:TIGR03016 family PEP-CTERM system-associated outer membrane protein [Alteromonas sp. PRIM-21]|uniref:TIGR03016 family PEP-CTERM system-associated outer membrane protein n=1 Tax=Alteromonas sp. PRIM-21 TaxID=1454978 RepID=UPI0022B9A968|nr:TIGR03016 family PEP-CTERM system-associated outer membrane protein [Alteromonas sp. PRIM-21]MCZ8529780.1 TIGR03016 family PEP-CTERM system-associated outer membrane protein [Alteromonas sp. PRIM-21]
MGTTTQSAVINHSFMPKLRVIKLSIIAFSVAISIPSQAKLEVSALASADTTHQHVKTEDNGTRSLTTFTIAPQVNAVYQTRTFQGLWSGTYTHLERDNDDTSQRQDYAEYNYSAQWVPFKNLLSFQAAGALIYQNTNSSNFLLSDFIANSDSLAKTRSNRLLSTLTLDHGDWVRGQGTASYSDTASERSLTNNNALDNDSYQLTGTLVNGDEAKYFIWSVTGTYQNTERSQTNNGDFESRTGDAYIDTRIYGDWAFRLTAGHEANQISDRDDTNSLVREFNSYGAGLTYRQAENRYISITANKSDSDIEDDDGETFVGVDLQWALSTRTRIAATYGRRFYGESASASIGYNSKYLRTSFSYSEDVTNTSRLLADPENLGVFVCPAATTSIADCFQPNSLSYTPNAGEQLVQLTSQNVEFDDNIILRKSANFQSGYDFSRVTLAFSWRYSEDDYLDEDRLRRTYSFGTNLAYKIGSYTNITSSISYANITGQGAEETFRGESDNWNASIGLEREFGRRLKASIDARYLEQEGDLSAGGQFGNNYTDRRISASITYTYD